MDVILGVVLLMSFLGFWFWWKNSTRIGAEWLLRDEIAWAGFGEVLREQGLQVATDQLLTKLVRAWNDSRGSSSYVAHKNNLERVYEIAKRAGTSVHAQWDDYATVGPCGTVTISTVAG